MGGWFSAPMVLFSNQLKHSWNTCILQMFFIYTKVNNLQVDLADVSKITDSYATNLNTLDRKLRNVTPHAFAQNAGLCKQLWRWVRPNLVAEDVRTQVCDVRSGWYLAELLDHPGHRFHSVHMKRFTVSKHSTRMWLNFETNSLFVLRLILPTIISARYKAASPSSSAALICF